MAIRSGLLLPWRALSHTKWHAQPRYQPVHVPVIRDHLNQVENRSVVQPSPAQLCLAFDSTHGAPDITCAGVPFNGTANWWAALMAAPFFLHWFVQLATALYVLSSQIA